MNLRMVHSIIEGGSVGKRCPAPPLQRVLHGPLSQTKLERRRGWQKRSHVFEPARFLWLLPGPDQAGV